MNAVVANEVKAMLEKAAPEFRAALPAHVPVDRFRRVAQTAILQSPGLMQADRRRLMSACVRAAQDGLLPDGREAALVLFKNQVQYMPMVAGILKKARNSGELASISANVVYENDQFDWQEAPDPMIMHRPKLTDRGAPIAVYAIAKLKSGEVMQEVLTAEEVQRIRGVSRAKDAGPWVHWTSEMWRKSAIRRLSKRLPMSTDRDEDLHRTIRRDDEWAGPKLDATAEPAPEPVAPSRLDALEEHIDAEPVSEIDFPGEADPVPAGGVVIENASPADLMAMAEPARGRK